MASSSASSPEISAALSTTTAHDRSAYKYSSLDEVLDDLSSRFILNLPDVELNSIERVCFQVEQAHWYYEDFIRENNPQYPSLPLKKFHAILFNSCPALQHWKDDHETAFDHFMHYKTRVPVCGAIMLNSTWDKCVLVKGWKASSGWGFPKGKINEEEPPHKCAAREVLEETGYDLSKQINPDHVILHTMKEQKISLYVVPGVPEDYPFETKTRKEISKIEWFKLTDLPTWRRNNKNASGKFYMVTSFIGPLKAFINEHKPTGGGGKPRRAANGHGHQPSVTQDSSSQSSSATDPQTPSPQQAQAVVHPAAIVQAHSEFPPMDSLDPQLARLLTGLTMSATQASPALNHDTSRKVLERDQPSSDSGFVQPSANPLSRLVSSPPPPSGLRSSPSIDLTPMRNPRHGPYVSQPIATPGRPETPSTARPPFLSSSSIIAASPSSEVTSASTEASTTTTTSSVTTRSGVSRRSSTADISPYLSRPAQVPMSGKHMKQLALLESVADESAQISQPRPAPFIRGPINVPRFSPNGQSQGMHVHPGLSSSVPPQGDWTPHPIYGRPMPSAPMNIGPVRSPYMPMGLPANTPSYPVYDDPFQVRPRTAAAMRQQTYPPPPPPPGGRSMHEAQLLSILSGAPGPGQLPGSAGALPPLRAGQPNFGGLVPTPLGRMGPAPPPLRVMPATPHLPLGGPAVPVTAPAYSPQFAREAHLLPLSGRVGPARPPTRGVAPGSAANLLSILNGPAPGVLNGPFAPR